MQNLSEPLNDDEIERLNQLLLNRVDDDADIDFDDADEGVLDISALDGFFTAIVSGPEFVMPSRWLPKVWGAFVPKWASTQDADEVLALMMRHMNNIAATLAERPEDFEPLFQAREDDGETVTIVDEWCAGYLRGVALAAAAWKAGGPQMAELLSPIRSFTSDTDWRAYDLPTDSETEKLRDAITPNVRAIHAYWLARRAKPAPASAPPRRPKSTIGYNDPCPCGSGKKFRDCCLH